MAKIPWKKTKLLIIDMDNTLCDTFHNLSKPQWYHVEKVLTKKGHTFHAEKLAHHFGKHGFVKTLKMLNFPKNVMKIAVEAYDDIDVSKLTLFDDAHELLDLTIPKVLVTRGDLNLQNRKIRHLGLRKYFKKVYIVETFGKKYEAFEQIMKDFNLKPQETIVIGDRIKEEIVDGKKLNMPTILVRRPDWPVAKSRYKPDLFVRKLSTVAKHFRNHEA